MDVRHTQSGQECSKAILVALKLDGLEPRQRVCTGHNHEKVRVKRGTAICEESYRASVRG